MIQLTGDFGRFALLSGDRRVLEINTEAATQIFKAVAIKKADVIANELGLYSYLNVGRNKKAKMMSLSVPKHLLQSRKNCLTWTPKGRAGTTVSEIKTEAVEYMGEQCPDFLMGECLEAVLGSGNDVRNILSTPEGRALFANALEGVFIALGNSVHDLATFGSHPLILDANTSGWWDQENTTQEEWDDFVDQQTGIDVKGHMTLIDESILPHLKVQIDSSMVSGDNFDSAAFDTLAARMKSASSNKLKNVSKRRRADLRVVNYVTSGIYDALETKIANTYGAISDEYRYQILRENGMREPVDGVLNYKGEMYICFDEQAEFDQLTGVNTHRWVKTVAGNFAIASDVETLSQYDGLGLRVVQRLDAPYKGRTFMDANFRIGAAIADHEFMSAASLTLTP